MQDHKDQFNSLRQKAIIVTGLSTALLVGFIFVGGIQWQGFVFLGIWLAFLLSPNETRTSFAKNKVLYIVVLILSVLTVIATAFVGLFSLIGAYAVSQIDNMVDANGNPI